MDQILFRTVAFVKDQSELLRHSFEGQLLRVLGWEHRDGLLQVKNPRPQGVGFYNGLKLANQLNRNRDEGQNEDG